MSPVGDCGGVHMNDETTARFLRHEAIVEWNDLKRPTTVDCACLKGTLFMRATFMDELMNEWQYKRSSVDHVRHRIR